MTPYRDRAAPRTAVVRPPARTRSLLAYVALLSLACLGLGLTAALGWAGDPFIVGVGAMLSGVAAVGVLLGPVRAGSGEAPCPACGTKLHDIQRSERIEGILCSGCGSYLRSAAGSVLAMSPDTVADEPLFGAALPETLAWPPGCVVCAAPVTRSMPAPILQTRADEDLALAAVGVASALVVGVGFWKRSGKRVTLSIPHCAAHEDGATLAEGGPTGLFVLFRSWPYQRAFCELNDVSPVESPETGRSLPPAEATRTAR